MMPQRLLQSRVTSVMAPVWLVFWAALLALAWLLPPHFPPWSTFPADAWMALMAMVGAIALVIRGRGTLAWHMLPCLVSGLVLLPWLQLGGGLLPYAGQAWMSSAYLLGFLLALLVGAHWEKFNPKQLAHGLFLAIGTASVLSVGLQIFSWLGLAESGDLGFWTIGQTSSRPSASLGQPNQLATLLLWGLLACLWAYIHKLLNAASALWVASFLMLGLVLAQSRAGMLALSGMLLAIWLWKRLWPTRCVPLAATGLYALYFAYAPLLRWLDGTLMLGQESIRVMQVQQGELRLSAWRLFAHAVLERPVFGYGLTDVASAQLALAEEFPSLGSIFKSSHNLFLDLLLWCGVPLGFVIVTFLICWFWSAARAVRQSEDAVLFMFLGAVGIHAMVEFPLHYAYFLIPVGLVMGIVNTRLRQRVVWTTPHWTLAGLIVLASLVVGVTFRDYAEVDQSYTMLRIEQSLLGQGRGSMGEAPDVLALTHLREWIRLARYKPHAGMSRQELEEVEAITTAIPSPPLAYELAKTFALNEQPDKAHAWLGRICKLTDEKECSRARASWELAAPAEPRTAAVSWPN